MKRCRFLHVCQALALSLPGDRIAASHFGIAVIALLAVVCRRSTIITYVLLCVCSAAGMQRVSLGPVERYGEVISGVFIGLVGVVFWIFPVM